MSTSGDSSHDSPHTYDPVVPHDITRASYHSAMGAPTGFTMETKETRTLESSGASMKSPRTARFAEATTIYSPVERSDKSPFADTVEQAPQGVADTGFGYVSNNNPVQHVDDSMPPMSPWRADLKVPKSARTLNPMSPTFREEYFLEKGEATAEKENARDVRIKLRVRIAKIFLRFVNFGCSLIVLAMLAMTLRTFMATRDLPERNSSFAWNPDTNPWAQWLLLGLACFSLLACMVVFWGYYKGGHKRAEKLVVYYSTISVIYFTFSFVMWIVTAAIYEHSKASGDKKDLWGWACAQNTREQIYSDAIDYALLCRLQDWGLVCAIIEVVIELLVILIYVVVFYRIWSKRRLMKSMNHRDQARSDLYLAQLHHQTAPNTPGFPGFTSYPPKSPFYASQALAMDPHSSAEKGEAGPAPQVAIVAPQYASQRSPTFPTASFQLQAPPIRVQQPTPRTGQEEFGGPHAQSPSPPPAHEHMHAAPGEQSYGSVPIPGAY
ncbi:hypothetical protein N7520_009363 [Penicillium odoratum]|uniref:uncharacterized protein n=1 Tax=Penicillium odoratum TaxID=1167516 RepID=UPI002547EC80|nr:uncharacterized protein N7520_009363 [Penicillium odoratum]KAJ5752446.1 hypothetical protein N7520_009363 [Penicillium odoratum]